MKKVFSQKGVFMVQALVMAVILSLMAVMMIKWAFSRHHLATKVRRSVDAKAFIEACMSQKAAEWGSIIPGDGSGTCVFSDVPSDGQSLVVNVQVEASSTDSYKKVTYTVDYDSL